MNSWIKPAPSHVVLEDDTYKGEIKIGFRFITNKEAHVIETREFLAEDKTNQEDQSVGALPTYGEFYGGDSCFVIKRILKISTSISRGS
ncbi:unnamed protein product [Prunus armeniaca]|uniref:Uncharacterized protein n=1 Tax=Prunus armeniaca TaxID=36596 RepID=A0A6J5WJ65_PRUAR|nr:unnamed protein product [Prunus armeniaca]